MFSRAIFLFCFLFCLPSISQANFFKEISCFKDMKRYYPDLIKGNLEWQQQKRFFRCFHDTLELFVEKNIFVHDSSRDHFTKEEIFKMFHLYFEYEEEESRRLTDQVFAVKKLLIGGSADQLKDQEIESIYKMVYDYQEIYFILHKQIPVFHKAFNEEESITPEEMEKALTKIKTAFNLLERAYHRENIVYQIDDLDSYDKYLKEFELVEATGTETVKQGIWFIQNLLTAVLFPQKEIAGENWKVALNSLYETFHFLFYYKTQFVNADLSPPFLTYKILNSAEIMLSALQVEETSDTENKRAIPLKNVDEMLSVLLSFLKQSSRASDLKDSFFANFDERSIPLLTRTLSCFSLKAVQEGSCKSEWKKDSSLPVVTLSFSDTQFEIFSDRMVQREQSPNEMAFIGQGQLEQLKQWLVDYKNSISKIYYGDVDSVALNRQFEHWLSPFFGWENNGRIEFGSFNQSSSNEKFYQLLDYQAFLSVLFSSYFPDGFFSSEEGEPVSISFKTWKRMVEDISPALVVLGGEQGYGSSWRSALFDLFYFADTFLYSSNRDELLSHRELIDLAVHFLEGMKSVKLAESKMPHWCDGDLNSSCVAKQLLKDQELLAVYPRFQTYLFEDQIDKYAEHISAILGKDTVQAFDLLPVFVLIQTVELNYDIIDRNQSFNLESDELALFANKFEEQLAYQIPFLSSKEQAYSYLMYSFKTGNMPFFTGDRLTTLEFSNWHLNSKNQQSFKISPNEFHFLIFDFYKLYKNL